MTRVNKTTEHVMRRIRRVCSLAALGLAGLMLVLARGDAQWSFALRFRALIAQFGGVGVGLAKSC